MANFPSSYDVFYNPGAGDNLNTTNVVHHTQHTDANNAISALERKVGVDGATATGTLDYLIKSADNPGHAHTFSGMSLRVTGATANATATTGFDLFYLSAITGLAITAKLPGSYGSGRVYWLKNYNSGTGVVSPSGSDTIDGLTSISLTGFGEKLTITDAISGKWFKI